MSAVGASLERRAMQLPVWPVIALVVTAVAMTIALKVIDEARPATPATAVQETDGFWDTTVTHPLSPRAGTLRVLDVSAIEASAAAVRELPAGPFHATGRAHEVVLGPDAAVTSFRAILADPDAWVTGVAANAPRTTDFTDCIHCMQRR